MHVFALFQGRREHDADFIASSDHALSVPTLHGAYIMRSQLESLWAARFEARGFRQAQCGITPVPCYFYEPRGMKRWPTYHAGRHYRIDFALVYKVRTSLLDGEPRSRAVRWEWASIKPAEDLADLAHLKALVEFDSLHQRAFQCCGHPSRPLINIITWNGTSCDVARHRG